MNHDKPRNWKNTGHNSAKRAAYLFFYLIGSTDEDVSVSFAADDACVSVFYGIEPEGKGNLFIPRYGGRVNPKIIEADDYTYMAPDKQEGHIFGAEAGKAGVPFQSDWMQLI